MNQLNIIRVHNPSGLMHRLLFVFYLFWFNIAVASDVEMHEIQIKDHKFIPNVITASPGKLIKLKVTNLDSTVEEFESFDLKREKIVPSNGGSITVTLGPLKPGEYSFFGEFNMDTAQGKLIIR